jgi:hypothetical protein
MGALRCILATVLAVASGCGDSGASDDGGSGADLQSCETDVASDPRHCGACGHDCLGGACQAGACQPVALADARAQPGGLIVAGGLAFWTETGSGAVLQVPIAGGMPQIVASGQAGAAPINADASFVYWINQGATYQVMKAPVGGGVAPTPLASGQGSPGVILVVGDALYWPSTATGEILKYPLPSGPVAPFVSTPTPYSVALDATAAFWTDQASAEVLMLPAGQTTPTPIASAQPTPGSIALSPTNVVWLDQGTSTMSYSDSAIWKYPRSPGATASKLADGSGRGTIAIDESWVYWTDRAGGRVLRIALDAAPGTAPTPLATAQLQPVKVVTDATAIYWTNAGNGGTTGSVMKLAK